MLNKHGLKMIGIKKAAGATADWDYTGFCNVIYYHRKDGDVICRHLGQNSWIEWHDKDMICVARRSDRMSMQQIADSIEYTLKEIDALKREDVEE